MEEPKFEIFANAITDKLFVSVDSLDYILASEIVNSDNNIELKKLRYKLNREIEDFLIDERDQLNTTKKHLIEKRRYREVSPLSIREAEDESE